MPSSWGDVPIWKIGKNLRAKPRGPGRAGFPGWTEPKRLAEGVQEVLAERGIRRSGWVPPALQCMVTG